MKRLLATFMVACAVSASGQGLTDSLIAHFPFDSSASALIGLLEPTDTIVGLSFCADAVGTPNSALCFDGSSLLSYGDVLDLGTEDFAVSFWFYLDTVSGLGPNEARRLVNKGGTFAGNPPNAGWMTNFEQVSPGNYTFEFSFNDGITFPVDSIEVPVSLDEWYQAVFTRCGQQHMLYLNCLPVDSFITTAGLNLDVSTYFALGGLDRRPGQNSQDGFFEGALDELRG
ncbi:MAG: hypothetical protein IPO17_15330 [Flavobacteriales bacterium]|nr:hypothetical protein [Flavobacteriales bacterium]